MKLTWAQRVFCDNVHENHLQQKKISLGFTLQHKLGIEKTSTKSVNKKIILSLSPQCTMQGCALRKIDGSPVL